ncbi:unnamed protein product [Penicillium olsonii]|nr:unnamed protein product [Penicillium olsonii]CAG7934199.1 unnamed protein product [Penicillium olsonii]
MKMTENFGRHPNIAAEPKLRWQIIHKIHWVNLLFTGIIPMAASVAGILWVPLKTQTAVFTTIFAACSSIAITAGVTIAYGPIVPILHHPILQKLLAILGASAGQNSIKKWCGDHRAHHRYVDSDRDPDSVHKGLFYAHYGWVVLKRKPGGIGLVNIDDLTKNTIVTWQHSYYPILLFLTAYVFPVTISKLFFDDFYGGVVYASCLRLFFIQQSTFCINSLAHWVGEKPFSGKSPCDNFLVALITYGEGYHNFHHEFPMDYRNGIRWAHYDPTKWFIWICAHINLAFDLKRFPENEIEKCRFQQLERQLEDRRGKISWGTPPNELGKISMAQYIKHVDNGRSFIVINDIVHDVSNFINDHPGGARLLETNIGKDCTKLFHGEVYAHSNAALNLLSTMQIARVENNPSQVRNPELRSRNTNFE